MPELSIDKIKDSNLSLHFFSDLSNFSVDSEQEKKVNVAVEGSLSVRCTDDEEIMADANQMQPHVVVRKEDMWVPVLLGP